MSLKKKLLIVEGESDKAFFEQLLSDYAIENIKIDVSVPNELDREQKNGKSGVFKILINKVSKLKDENYIYSHIGCIVDTDYKKDGHDLVKKLDQLKNDMIRQEYGDYHQHSTTGYYFSSPHKDKGFNNIGIWFMPNNQDDGMFEDWLLKIVKPTEQVLIDYAEKVCQEVSEKRFEDIHFSKAQVGVWTSLQKAPALGVNNLFRRMKKDNKGNDTNTVSHEELYDPQSPDFQNFISWLKFIYD